MTEPMTLTEFEREAASVAHKTIAFSLAIYPWEAKRVITNLRPLILRLLAAERELIAAAVPGGDICDPQEVADMIRAMGDIE